MRNATEVPISFLSYLPHASNTPRPKRDLSRRARVYLEYQSNLLAHGGDPRRTSESGSFSHSLQRAFTRRRVHLPYVSSLLGLERFGFL